METKMTISKKDLSVLDRFDFDVQPVGVKFMSRRPDRIERLEEKLAFCEMLKKAQEGTAFFADAGAQACEAGRYVLGQADAPGPYISGEFGAGLKIFEEPRSAARLYHYIPRISPGVVNCVAFSPLNTLSFRPGCFGHPGPNQSDRNSAAGHELSDRPNVVQQIFSGHRLCLDFCLSLFERGTELCYDGSGSWDETEKAVSRRPPVGIDSL